MHFILLGIINEALEVRVLFLLNLRLSIVNAQFQVMR